MLFPIYTELLSCGCCPKCPLGPRFFPSVGSAWGPPQLGSGVPPSPFHADSSRLPSWGNPEVAPRYFQLFRGCCVQARHRALCVCVERIYCGWGGGDRMPSWTFAGADCGPGQDPMCESWVVTPPCANLQTPQNATSDTTRCELSHRRPLCRPGIDISSPVSRKIRERFSGTFLFLLTCRLSPTST